MRKRLGVRPAAHVTHYRDAVAAEVGHERIHVEVRVPDGEHRTLVHGTVKGLVKGLRLRGCSIIMSHPRLRLPLGHLILRDGLGPGYVPLDESQVLHHQLHIRFHRTLLVRDEPVVKALLADPGKHLRRAVVLMEHPLVVQRRL